MKIDGRELDSDEVFIIAAPPDPFQENPHLITCAYCGVILAIDAHSIELVKHGLAVTCIYCALQRYPDVIAGRDPDTGRPLTLREMIRQPNSIGGYDYEDVKEL